MSGQWGALSIKSDSTITFPVAYLSSTYSVVSTAFGLNEEAHLVSWYAGITSYSLTNFSFNAAGNASGRMWLSTGV